MRLLGPILAMIFSMTFLYGNDVELRFTQNRVEGDLLFIDIDIRGSSYDFNLASHNIRAFYDHKSLELFDVVSQLPEGKYAETQIEQLYTDGNDLDLGALTFEDHLGFINMSVQLIDLQSGGMLVSTDWTTIHTATFKILNNSNHANLVWAHEDKTAGYATAFVVVLEWISPEEIEVMNNFDLVNFDENIQQNVEEVEKLEVEIGLSSDSDTANINVQMNSAILSIIDTNGGLEIEQQLDFGNNVVDISTLGSGNYLFMVSNESSSYTEQVEVAK